MKYIIFDLDETLGHFVQLGIFFESLKMYFLQYENRKISYDEIGNLLKIFPNYFRPHIIQIMKYIGKNKKNVKIVLFTNNQGPKQWATNIIKHLNKLSGVEVFSTVIGAYKIADVINEPLRSSNMKKISDLERILNLNNSDKILFFDDQHHSYMIGKNVKYIRLSQYIYHYEYPYMIEKYYKSNSHRITSVNAFIEFMTSKLYGFYFPIQKTNVSLRDNEDSKKIMKSIIRFLRNSKTRKNHKKSNKNNKSKTHKNKIK